MTTFTYASATANRQRDRLGVTDAELAAARDGEHGTAACYAATEFIGALRTIQRREAGAQGRLQEIINSATAEQESGRAGNHRHGDRFTDMARQYERDCTAIGKAIDVIDHTGRMLAVLLGVKMDGCTAEQLGL